MKPTQGNPTNNPAKAATAAPGVTATPAQSIPKSDLRPDKPAVAGAGPAVGAGKPSSEPLKADSKPAVAPSHGKGRDAD